MMEPGDGLVWKLNKLADQHGEVRLINAFRGVPIIHPAKVVAAENGRFVFDVHPEQSVCLSLDGRTHLLLVHKSSMLQAVVGMVDMLQNQVVLQAFQRARMPVGKRLAVRLQPKSAIYASIRDGVHHVPVQVEDISPTGIGISVTSSLPDEQGSGQVLEQIGWRRGQMVYVDLQLPGLVGELCVKARIVSLSNQQGSVSKKAGLAFSADSAALDRLKDYIEIRQSEILDEIHRLYERLCRRQGQSGDTRITYSPAR